MNFQDDRGKVQHIRLPSGVDRFEKLDRCRDKQKQIPPLRDRNDKNSLGEALYPVVAVIFIFAIAAPVLGELCGQNNPEPREASAVLLANKRRM